MDPNPFADPVAAPEESPGAGPDATNVVAYDMDVLGGSAGEGAALLRTQSSEALRQRVRSQQPLAVGDTDETARVSVASWNVEQYIPELLETPERWLDLCACFRAYETEIVAADANLPPELVVLGLQEVQNPFYTYLPGAYSSGGVSMDAMVEARLPQAAGARTRFGSFDPYLRRRWLPHVLLSLEKAFGDWQPESGRFPAVFSYLPVVCAREVGRGLVLLRHAQSRWVPRQIALGSAGSGIAGVGGNKGAVACALTLSSNTVDDSGVRVAFANVHLAAHEGLGPYLSRNDELQYLLRHTILWSTENPGDPPATLAACSALVLLGDTNYRLSGLSALCEPSAQKPSSPTTSPAASPNTNVMAFRRLLTPKARRAWIIERIAAGSFEALLEIDECQGERLRASGVLRHFREPPITFPPTYKFVSSGERRRFRAETPYVPVPGVGSPRSSAERYSDRRLPAYCDRILYYSAHTHAQSGFHMPGRAASVTLRSYRSVRAVQQSDHRPVAAVLVLNVAILRERAAAAVAAPSLSIATGATDGPDLWRDPRAPIVGSAAVAAARRAWLLRLGRSTRPLWLLAVAAVVVWALWSIVSD